MEYTISHEGEITYINVEGTVSEDFIKHILKEVWAGKDYEHPCILWDFRSCILGLGIQELRELSHFTFGDKGERGYGRVALVVDRNLHFTFSRIYEVYTEKLPFEVRGFRDIEAAKRWLHEGNREIFYTTANQQSPMILIADDHDISIQTFSEYLTVKGYQVAIARNGREAVKLTKQRHPDLIVMDMQMPEMNGFEAIRRIRMDETTRNTPIIAVTALVMPGDRERCLEAGADEYLGKPVSLRKLQKMIEELLFNDT